MNFENLDMFCSSVMWHKVKKWMLTKLQHSLFKKRSYKIKIHLKIEQLIFSD